MKKILLIEDDEKIALGLSVRLKAHGYATWIARDGITGLKLAVRYKPDLILLDISLPAGNGFELAERFQSLPETSHAPIIFATASKDPDLRKKALQAGAAGLLRKPYDANDLLALAQNALEEYAPSASPKAAPAPASAPSKRILIVEDDSATAAALEVRLRGNGYTTWSATDAILALSLAVRHRPDLILLDVTLPGGDGYRLAQKLQQAPETRDTPILFVTGSKDPELRQKVMELGAAGLLEKPFETEELLLMTKLAFGRVNPAHRDAALAAGRSAKGNPQLTLKHILIIEDDEKIARSLSLRLQAAGYQTTIATDGLSGVKAAAERTPDLVLLDISLPAGDGFTVAERIQTHIPTPTSIIFLTASKRPEFRQRALELGAAGFFEKPFEAQDLLASIRRSFADSPRPS